MIKAIISDIGNVLVKVSLSQWVESFKQIGISISSNLFQDSTLRQMVDLYCEGKISTEECAAQISREIIDKTGAQSDISFEQFKHTWHSIVPTIYLESIRALQSLRSRGYKVYALSDINELHIAHIERLYQQEEPNKLFEQLFDKPYYSHITGYSKARDEAWLQILKEQSLKPEECLFIDDLSENIERAHQLGFHTFHYKPENTMQDVLVALEELVKVR